jgi:hypothetical protein
MLLLTADDLGDGGPDNVYGYGALNLTQALESLKADRRELSAAELEAMELNKRDANVGDPVMIEAKASGVVKAINSHIIGPDRTLEIPMDDFDANGIYSARWETSFWTPGDYQIQVSLQGRFGEVDSKAVPFRLGPGK